MSQPLTGHARLAAFLRPIRPACGATAALALAFSAVVATGMLRNVNRTPPDPQADEAFAALKARLVTDPANAKLKEEIRAADLRLRAEFFHLRAMTRRGAYLLAFGVAVGAIALGLFLVVPPRPARPASPLEEGERSARPAAARAGVLAVVCLLIGGAIGWAVYGSGGGGVPVLSARAPDSRTPRPIPVATTTSTAPTMPAGNMPGLAEIRKNWPRFRGPLGAGVSESDAPTQWNGKTGEGVLWKKPLPLAGYSSPVVWGGRVVVTAADKTTRKLLCFDAAGGGLLWEKEVRTQDSPSSAPGVPVDEEPQEDLDANTESQRPMSNAGYAASSPAADGNCFCAIFANGDIACYDLDGNQRWARNLRFGDNSYGYASSLDLVGGLVIVQIDQGAEEEGKSRLVALDAGSGAVRWEVKRPVGGAWSSPIVVPMGSGAAVLACGNPFLIAHDLTDGGELWRAKVGGGDGAPSPILAGGLALATVPSTQLSAVRTDGVGDVTETHVAWTADQDVPDITSPVSDGRLVWTLTSMGALTCYDVASGRKMGSKELRMNFLASPSIAGGKLYLLAETGTMLILEANPEARQIARCELGERTGGSPAFAGGCIYLRSAKNLYCIGTAKRQAP